MFRLSKMFRFEAAHFLPHHDGKCRRMHGHSWQATIVCEGYHLKHEGPKQGMLLDYGEISDAMEPIVDGALDHHLLNDTVNANPTSEVVAVWIYFRLRDKLPGLKGVIIEETCTSRCEYFPSPDDLIGR